jgi:hypothetical protein
MASLKLAHFPKRKTLFAVILTGLSAGLTAKMMLLKRFSATEEIYVPSSVPMGLCRSLKRSAANMPRLWFSQDSRF